MQNDHVFEDGFSIVKGTALSVAVSLLGAIILAVILRTCALPDKIIYPVNQTIKAVAVILGVLCFISGEKGWMKGGVTGLLFTALSNRCFKEFFYSFLKLVFCNRVFLHVIKGADYYFWFVAQHFGVSDKVRFRKNGLSCLCGLGCFFSHRLLPLSV